MAADPWNIDPMKFATLISQCHDDPQCACEVCTFVNMIPGILDALGTEPVR